MKKNSDKEPLNGGGNNGVNPDPFGEYPEKDKGEEKKQPKLKPSKRIAYAAAATAIASVASVITVFLPVRVVPLLLAAFCFYLTYVKCGIVHGVISATAATLITLTGGLNTSLVLLCVCFFPYSLICLAIRKFDYKTVKGALIRAAVVIVFVNIAFVATYFIAKYAVLGGLDVIGAVGGLGKFGYLIAAAVLSVVAVLTDFAFVLADKIITPKIK